MNPITGEPAQPQPLFGHGPDFGYSYYGSVWYGNEIWNGGRFVDYDKDGRTDAWEVLRWNDENRAGKGDFQPWTKHMHPELGEVEIGGFNPKFYGQNPPPDMIETWARNEAMFNLYLAQQLLVSELKRGRADALATEDDEPLVLTNPVAQTSASTLNSNPASQKVCICMPGKTPGDGLRHPGAAAMGEAGGATGAPLRRPCRVRIHSCPHL